MVWKPAKGLGLIVGLVVLATIVGVQLFIANRLVGLGMGLNLYVTALLLLLSLPLLALWIYWYYGLATLRYVLDRNALVIHGGSHRHVVPTDAVRQVLAGTHVRPASAFRGVGWPGYLSGRMRLEELGELVVCSTEPLERQVVVVTDARCYGISPRDPERFAADLAARQALQPIRPAAQAIEPRWLAALPLWRDRWFWSGLGLAVLANLVLFALVAAAYPALPERLPLLFDAQGQVISIADKSNLLVVPAIGALTLAVNGLASALLHARERVAAYSLLGMAVAIQGVVWVAAAGILGW